jgi:hypothetical protein
MALRTVEPGGDYTTNRDLVFSTTGGAPIVVNNMFYGGTRPGWRVDGTITAMEFPIPDTNTIIFQYLFKVVGAGAASTIVAFREAATTHIDVRYANTGQLTVTRNGTLLGSSAVGIISPNTEYYLGVKAKIDDAVGWVVVTVNGAEVINVVNADTRNGGTGLCNKTRHVAGNSIDQYFRDVLIMDAVDGTTLTPPQNAAFNDFLGPVRLSCKFPNAVGSYVQGTITGAATIQEALDETVMDSDTSYVSLAVTEKFTNNLQDMSQSGGRVHGVVLFDASRVDDASTVTQRQIAKLGVNESQLVSRNLGASYAYDRQVLVKPGGGTWDIADVNALEIGVERTA